MKISKVFGAVAASILLLSTGCQKINNLQDRVNTLEGNLTSLEGKVTSIAEAVSALQNVINNHYLVDNIVNAEGVYTINFSNGKGDKLTFSDTLIKSITESDDAITIVLNDAKGTTFVLAKAFTLVIGDPESELNFILLEEGGENEVALSIPDWENIASVAASLAYTNGISNAVVTKAAEPAEPWTVAVTKDFKTIIIGIPESAKPGESALLTVTVSMNDGTTHTSSKAIVFQATDDQLFEEISLAIEDVQAQLTQAMNATINNEEDKEAYAEVEGYKELCENVSVLFSGIAQNIESLKAWAEEDWNRGKLVDSINEIYEALFGEFNSVQILITQAMNVYNDGIVALHEAAYEDFAAAFEGLQKQWTQVFNSTVGDEKYAAFTNLISEYTATLNSIYQQMETLQTWAEESYENCKLIQDLEEIYMAMYENNDCIQNLLTQYLNAFNGAVENINDLAYEEYAAAKEALQQKLTVVYNETVRKESHVERYSGVASYEETCDIVFSMLSGVSQTISDHDTWVEESYTAGTLAEELGEIVESLNSLEVIFVQAKNVYNDAIGNLTFEEFAAKYNGANEQWTMVYNSTVNNQENAAIFEGNEKYEALVDQVTTLLSGISQAIQTKSTWAEESFVAGTIVEDLDEILASFEPDVEIPLTQVLNIYNDGVNELYCDMAFEDFSAAYEGMQQQWTMFYNSVNDFYKDAKYAEAVESFNTTMSGIAQNLGDFMTWATESYEKGSLAEEFEEIMSSMEQIQIQMTQAMNAFNNAIGEE